MNDYCPFIIYLFYLILDFCVLILFKWKITAKPHIVSPGLPSMELEPRAAEHGFGRQGGGARPGPASGCRQPPRARPCRPAGAPKPIKFHWFWRGRETLQDRDRIVYTALAQAQIRGVRKDKEFLMFLTCRRPPPPPHLLLALNFDT